MTNSRTFCALAMGASLAYPIAHADDTPQGFVADPVIFRPSLVREVLHPSNPSIKSLGLFVNDTFWDGQDRWRSGSYQRSWEWDESYELRWRSEYITPSNLTNPDTQNDRPYAAVLNIGLFRLIDENDHEFRVGVSLDAINKIRIMSQFHAWVHGQTGFSGFGVDDFIVDPAYKLSAEASWRYTKRQEFGYIVPFVETQYGTRERITAGLDVIITDRKFDWIARDQTTGNLLGLPEYPKGHDEGLDFIMGGDVSYVAYDYFLENSVSNVETEHWRYRFRFGFRYHYNGTTMFVGPTYLSPEFVGGKGQFLQTLSVEMNLL